MIPDVLDGKNVLIRAGTGSGKTEAAIAPLTSRYWNELVGSKTPVILYITPTRALANDIKRRLGGPLGRLGLSVGVKHYDRNDLARATLPNVLVTTPEGADILVTRHDKNLAEIRAVVIDEVHAFYNTQRGFQMGSVIRRLQSWLDRPLQSVAVSATAANAPQVEQFFPMLSPLVDHAATGQHRPIELRVRIGQDPSSVAALLGNLLDSDQRIKVLVFANSRHSCDQLAEAFRQDGRFPDAVYVHHSAISKDERERSAVLFADARRAVCVATSTLEVGIDIGDIDVVVLYGVPSDWGTYLQRVGRGGRRAEFIEVLGVGVYSKSIGDESCIEQLGFQALHEQFLNDAFLNDAPHEMLGAAAQQVVALMLEANKAGRGDVGIGALVSHFSLWPHLDENTVELICLALIERGVIRHSRGPGIRRFALDDAGWDLVDNFGYISNMSEASSMVKVIGNGREVGEISRVNLLNLRVGSRFLLGKPWEIQRFTGGRIFCKSCIGQGIEKIKYSSAPPLVDARMIEGIRALIEANKCGSCVQSRDQAHRLEAEYGDLAPFVASGRVPFANLENGWRLATFGGKLLNRALAEWFNENPNDADDILVPIPGAVDLQSIPASIEGLGVHFESTAPGQSDLSVFQSYLSPELSRREYANSWLRRTQHHITLARLRSSELVQCDARMLAVLTCDH